MTKRILMMAGGTGGHIFPALAIANAMKAAGVEVQWLGSRGGMECRIVGAQFPMHCLRISGLRGRGFRVKLLLPYRLLVATLQALYYLWQFKPDLVISMGGFVAGPGGLAAWLARKRLIVHEQNAIAGMTNRYLSRGAALVMSAYPNVLSNHAAAVEVGNPIRKALTQLPAPDQRLADRSGPLRILVLGGSRGAALLNQGVLHWLQHFSRRTELALWHQTGEAAQATVSAAYQAMGMQARVDAFIEDMAAAFAWVDVMICRAGALTVAEIAAVGVASIFVPYAHAVDNHQLYNAQYLADQGAASVILEADFNDDALTAEITPLLDNREQVMAHSVKAKAVGRPEATAHIVTLLENMLYSQA